MTVKLRNIGPKSMAWLRQTGVLLASSGLAL